MESDIVERLRGAASKDYGCQCPKCEAADEIDRLRAELAKMREQRDEAVEMYKDLLRRLSVSTPPRYAFLSGDASDKEGGGACGG